MRRPFSRPLHGLLATIAFNLFFDLSFFYPLTSDISVWYTSAAFLPVVVMLALAIWLLYFTGRADGFQGSVGERVSFWT